VADRFIEELRAAAAEADRDEAFAGIHRIAVAAGLYGQTQRAESIGEVCDMIAAWCRSRRVRQPGQVPPGHPDAGKPAGWGEHPRDCDCGDCP
jgi:hypothetical protein